MMCGRAAVAGPMVAHHEAGLSFFDRPGRREAERPGAASNRLVGVVSGAVPMLCKEELIFAVTIVNASTARLPLFVRLRLRFARCVMLHDGRPWWVFC